jgi:hypothetical protein
MAELSSNLPRYDGSMDREDADHWHGFDGGYGDGIRDTFGGRGVGRAEGTGQRELLGHAGESRRFRRKEWELILPYSALATLHCQKMLLGSLAELTKVRRASRYSLRSA